MTAKSAIGDGASGNPAGLEEAAWRDRSLTKPWKTVLASSLSMMWGPSAVFSATFGVFAAGLESKTGWAHSSVAYAATMISLMVMCASPLQGFLSDKLGGRRFALFSMPLFAIGLMCLQFATKSISTFYIGMAIITVAGLGIWPVAYMKVVVGWFERRIGIAVGVVMAGLGVSTTVFPILFGWGFRTIGWSGTYFAVGAFLLLVVWPVCIRWLREPEKPLTSAHARASAKGSASGFQVVLQSKVFWITLGLFFVLGFINSTLLVHGIAIMKAGGVPLKTALAIQSFVGVGVLAGRLGTGWLLDRTHVRVMAVAMFAAAAAAFSILSSPMAAQLAVLSSCLGGLIIGAEFDILGVLIRRFFGTAVFGRSYGIVFSIFQLGGAAGSAGLAFALAKAGSFTPALGGLVIASLVCAVLSLLIGRDPARLQAKAAA